MTQQTVSPELATALRTIETLEQEVGNFRAAFDSATLCLARVIVPFMAGDRETVWSVLQEIVDKQVKVAQSPSEVH